MDVKTIKKYIYNLPKKWITIFYTKKYINGLYIGNLYSL